MTFRPESRETIVRSGVWETTLSGVNWTPVSTEAAFAKNEMSGRELAGALVAFLQALNLFGSPAILAIPAGFRPDGLPGGVTLVAPAFCDDALAALGQRLHQAGFFGMGCDREAAMSRA
jgi:Asp-tRNA(Asn)/Glu-tRNA(Gln) amidotransferase A subunit family amidase